MKNIKTFYIPQRELIDLFKISFPEWQEEKLAQEFLDAIQFLDSDSLFDNQDYNETNNDGKREYTKTGAEKIASRLDQENNKNLATKIQEWFFQKKRLKKKDRLLWIETSANIFKQTIDRIIDSIIEDIKKREKDVNSAKTRAKTRDKKTCQVTNVKNDEITEVLDKKIEFVAHHLYSQNDYPDLASDIDNLITINEKVHNQFHIDYMGYTDNLCTIDDFIKFVQKYYPSNKNVLIWLMKQKYKLEKKLENISKNNLSKRKPHIFNQNPQRFLPPSSR